MAEQGTVDLLWNCASKLTAASHAERLLKSHYLTTCRRLARHSVQLPEEGFGPARMCARCGTQWTDARYRLLLEPQAVRASAKHRRLVARLEAAKAGKLARGELSAGARKRAKWLKKRTASHVTVDCEVCRHKTMLTLEKGQRRSAKPKATVEEDAMEVAQQAATGPNKKKAKKKSQKKDANAGLKIPQQQATGSRKGPQPVQKPSQAPKKKNQKKTKPAPPALAQKTQSKTQKQNALLHLASQLKSHAFKDASKSQANRLQAFLK
ncbi:hypothetical protein KR018_001924 [Drosophila ironensis]|nr:hypothetical protein KR018_001924 [Drosophila ironensis]